MIEVVLLIAIIILCIYKAVVTPRNLPPGPMLQLPVVGYLPFIGKKPVLTMQKLAQEYGKMFMINCGLHRLLIMNDFDTLQEAFKKDVFSGRPELELFLIRSLGGKNGLIFSEGAHWREQRRFTLRHLRDFGFGRKSMESLIAEEMMELVANFRKEEGHPINLFNKFNLAILNALWNITTGERFSHDDPRLSSFTERISRNIAQTDFVGDPGMFFPFLKYFSERFNVASRAKDMTEELFSMFREKIDYHKQNFDEDNLKDFIDVYLKQMKNTSDPESSFYKETGEKHFFVTLLDLFVAGSETTSTTLMWAFLHLVRNPGVQRKVHEELDRVVGRDRFPCLEDKAQLPYTEATIQEVQRYIPIVPFSVPHATLDDIEFQGYNIPKDTIVLANLFHIQRDPKYWGDPDTFRPERFLTPDGEVKRDERVIPFSVGKRICLGESLARTELFIFFTGLMSQFTFSAEPDVHPPAEFNIGSVLLPVPYKVIVKSRN